ncbi:DUF2442 domain-containing protein [Solirubrum puertoriconensis]|uniref:DUF2442 domain-containing protein n=1 Tax=Solirubrum puertoriconensis TaxID=1751427 RepID=A0A9X0HML8_SOLP1|nr:DUF2442 domain-containing protein [Solirubrum puertoriconensis]KUG08705.1 hypothetical protein ASU33_11225 [Solirubrum puertoriconensis]
MPNINRVEFTATAIYLHLSDGTFRSCLFTQACAAFLYHATPQQRANWTLEKRDSVISWPDLGVALTVDGWEIKQHVLTEAAVG